LDLQNEFDEIEIHLIPEHLREGSAADFLTKLKEFDPIYDKIKEDQNQNHVLRYIEIIGRLANDKGILEVKLVSVPSDTALGGEGSDSFFEIYTESYENRQFKRLEQDLQLQQEEFWRYFEVV
jgi:aspartokinase/homoserine dehydrogenase 1